MTSRFGAAALVLGMLGLATPGHGAAPQAAAAPVLPAAASAAAPLPASVVVDNFALVERAPVRNGFSPFTIEATGLLPAPRKRESFTPSEDEHFHSLHRTVERFLRRKEIPKGWSRSNEARIGFETELARFRSPDGIAYAVEGELVVRGTAAIPLGLKLTAPSDGVPLRYSAGLIIADQVVLMKEGLFDEASRSVGWMLSMRPNGPDAAIPIRAVFAVRAEGTDAEANRKSLAAIQALMTASSDGRPATAERTTDAAEWLKPLPAYLRPGQVPGAPAGKPEKGKGKPEKAAH
jgi:hypothetical protein